MAEFKILQKEGVDIYPVTHPDAVRDEQGNSIMLKSASALPSAVEGVTTLVRNTTYGSPASPITLSGTMQIAYPATTDHSEAVLYCVIAEGANITFNGTHYNEPSTDATTIIALARDNAWYFGAFQTA